jgi:hypothetical protein
MTGEFSSTFLEDLDRYLDHLFGETRYYILVSTLDRNAGDKWVEGKLIPYYPGSRETIARKIARAGDDGLDAYLCAHGYRDRTRPAQKGNAAPITCLWVERDAATIPPGVPPPTMTIETSPGRYHDYWRLSRSVAPTLAENLNRRLTQHIGGEAGWALTKRLRPPGSRNFKHAGGPVSRIVGLDEARTLDPDDLDRILPPVVEAVAVTELVVENDAVGAPVRLPPALVPLWRGERPVVKPDGSGVIDRSASLWAIARALWKANASRRAIVAALTERDRALGWNTYTDRPGEYVRIAAKVAASGDRGVRGQRCRSPEPPTWRGLRVREARRA